MNSIRALINEMRRRPELYVGKKSLSLVHAYINGWLFRDEDSVVDSKLIGEFQDWIQKKYRINSSHSWCSIIVFFSNEEYKALERFFELWDEFLENREA